LSPEKIIEVVGLEIKNLFWGSLNVDEFLNLVRRASDLKKAIYLY
jgi:hypothetical protein